MHGLDLPSCRPLSNEEGLLVEHDYQHKQTFCPIGALVVIRPALGVFLAMMIRNAEFASLLLFDRVPA